MLCIAGACEGPGASDPGWTAALNQLHGAIVSSTGYPAGSVEVIGSMGRVNVMISDRELARADRGVREHVSDAVVIAVEESMTTNARLTNVDEIRVVIVHPEEGQGLLGSTHTEDVMEFRKGPNQRFFREVL
jgi:hypothetical protein